MTKAEILAALNAGGPEGVKLLRGLGACSRGADTEVLAAARRLADDLTTQRREKALADAARYLDGREAYYLRDPASGQRLEIRGFAAIYATASVPLSCNAQLPEVLAPGCFDERDLRQLAVLEHHDWAAPVEGQLDVALGATGLLFRVSNLPSTPRTQALADSIRAETAGCSFSFRPEGTICDWQGQKVFMVSRARLLGEISITREGAAYPDALCWLAPSKSTSRTFISRMAWDFETRHSAFSWTAPKKGRRAA